MWPSFGSCLGEINRRDMYEAGEGTLAGVGDLRSRPGSGT